MPGQQIQVHPADITGPMSELNKYNQFMQLMAQDAKNQRNARIWEGLGGVTSYLVSQPEVKSWLSGLLKSKPVMGEWQGPLQSAQDEMSNPPEGDSFGATIGGYTAESSDPLSRYSRKLLSNRLKG